MKPSTTGPAPEAVAHEQGELVISVPFLGARTVLDIQKHKNRNVGYDFPPWLSIDTSTSIDSQWEVIGEPTDAHGKVPSQKNEPGRGGMIAFKSELKRAN